jgi:photosystem II stability/assembly factor-like uncharacterized protein
MNTPTRWWTPIAVAAALSLIGSGTAAAQDDEDAPRFTPSRVNATADPLLRSFRWRTIGPVAQGGRVDDVAVVERDPRIFYVAFATGGVWKTENAGTTFEPIFEAYGTGSVGAVAVTQSNPDIVWVGTGEANGRNNSAFGDGVYKSTDGGKTFTHMGLRETQTIQRILIDPRNQDVVYVAALGHLHGPNPERGLFKTTDGGKTWQKVLFVDNDTGVVEIVFEPGHPDVIYAASYQRRRAPWGFNGGGPGSGIWKSEDAGAHFGRLTGNGLPGGPQGRIGLAVAPSNPSVVYAQIEVLRDEARVADASQATTSTSPEKGVDQAGGVWRSADKGATWEFRSDHNVRPQYYSELAVDPKDENVVYSVGREFYRSMDGGRRFDVVVGPGHADHHAIWINPSNPNHLLIGNDGGPDVTYDRGRTWEAFRTMPVGQFGGLSVDMQRPYYVYGGLQDNGSWGGPSQTRGAFISAYDWFSIGGGDGDAAASDPTGHEFIYSEGQRGAIQRLEMRTGRTVRVQPRAPTAQDPTSNIVPAPAQGEEFRWNWAAPFFISKQGPNTLYLGGNRLFKSLDRGDTWTMSLDLTRKVDTNALSIMGQKGSLPYCHGSNARIARGQDCILSKADGTWFYSAIYTISESPLPGGPLWVGTDDGVLQVSRDGESWTDVTANVKGAPQGCYVSRVEASNFEIGTAYVAFNCNRSDDLRPYLFVTKDFGATWTSIAADLPATNSVNVIRQDPKNPDLLFAGTEFGFYASLDGGKSWKRFMTGLPVTRVDEVIVHPRDGDLVLGTYGRSVLIMDDITPLQQLTPAVLAEDVHLFQPRNAVLWLRDARLGRSLPAAKQFRGENPAPGTAIHYYLKQPVPGGVKVRISRAGSPDVFREMDGPGDAGLNRVQWDLLGNPTSRGGATQAGRQAAPGTYRVTLVASGKEFASLVVVEQDVWMDGGD